MLHAAGNTKPAIDECACKIYNLNLYLKTSMTKERCKNTYVFV